MKKLLPLSIKNTIFTLRENISKLEKERIQLQDEIENDSQRVKLAKIQLSEKPVLVDLAGIMSKLNENIESNMSQLKAAKIKRKRLNRAIDEIKQMIANSKEFKQINETEIERDERIVSEYKTLISEMCTPPRFPDPREASQANWIIASKHGGDVTPELFEIMEGIHQFNDNFHNLDSQSMITAFKLVQRAIGEMKHICKEYTDLTNLEGLDIDTPRIRHEKQQCAQDYTYLRLSIDRLFREPRRK